MKREPGSAVAGRTSACRILGQRAKRHLNAPWVEAKSARVALFVGGAQTIERTIRQPTGELTR